MRSLTTPHRSAIRLGAALTLFVAVACGEDPAGPGDPTDPSSPTDVNAYVGTLPDWDSFSPTVPDSDEATGDAELLDRTVSSADGDVVYECTETPKSLWRTPNQIVTYEPNASIMWVGNLIQGKSYAGGQGSFEELSIRQRVKRIIIRLRTGRESNRPRSRDGKLGSWGGLRGGTGQSG